MSENAFAGDLLSSLASNPELLKNAMQMASALASSGMLNGLFGGGSTTPEQSSASASTAPSAPSPAASPQAGGFADLLAGLLGQSGGSAESPKQSAPADKAPELSVPVPAEREHKRGPAPSHHDRIHLLQSICPFLPEEKREKVQFLIKLLGLLSAAEQMGLGKLF